jgi:hypothetical protein
MEVCSRRVHVEGVCVHIVGVDMMGGKSEKVWKRIASYSAFFDLLTGDKVRRMGHLLSRLKSGSNNE